MENFWLLPMILLLVKLSDGADELDELMIMPETANAVEAGEPWVMTCQYAPEVVSNVKWIGPDGMEISDAPGVTLERDEEKFVILTINVITSDDEGIYTCEGFSSSANATIDVKRTVVVFEPVKIINTPAEQEFQEGQTASVICNVEGNPEPDVFWLDGLDKIEVMDGEKFSMEAGSTNLIIRNISQEDEGVYTCKARQLSQGKVKDILIAVEVIIPPEIQNFDADIYVIEGNDQKLACDATGEPGPTYSWFSGDGTIADETTMITEGSMLALVNVTRGMTGNQYTCIARNKIDYDLATLTLTVYVKPYFTIIENDTTQELSPAKLRCVAEGYPEPRVSFYRHGIRMEEVAEAPTESADNRIDEYDDGNSTMEEYAPDLPVNSTDSSALGQWAPSPPPSVVYNGNEAVLSFAGAYKADAGKYECRAESLAGLEIAEVTLDVQYGPQNTDLNDVFACANQIASLECQIDANPAPTLSWGLMETPEGSNDVDSEQFVAFNVSDLPEGITIVQIGDILQLNVETSAVPDPFKIYYCRAENNIDYAVASAEIVRAPVPEPPLDVIVSNIGTKEATITITPPLAAFVPIKTFMITLVPTPNDLDMQEQRIDGSMNNYTFIDLTHDTEYTVSVTVENCADTGPPNTDTKFRTKAIENPDPVKIISGRASEHHDKYTVEWNLEGSGGGEITKITIMLNKVVKDLDSNETTSTPFGEEVVVKPGEDSFHDGFYVFEGLGQGSDYEVIVSIYNEVGRAKTKKMFTTATNPETTPNVATGSFDVKIIAIIVAVLLIIIIIIDVTCFFTRSWGFTMWIYTHTCGKPTKHKVEDAEEGSAEYRQGQEGTYSEKEQS